MKDLPSSDCLLRSRKKNIQQQIRIAIDQGRFQEVYKLQSRWVHRYGYSDLPLSLSGPNQHKENISLESLLVMDLESNDLSFADKKQGRRSICDELINSEKSGIQPKVGFQEDLPIRRVRSFIGNSSEEFVAPVSQIPAKQLKQSENNVSSSFPPPPRKSTPRNLRRWLADSEDERPKAC
ncbi:hypothetical protein [Prochlorococcus sp. MIT 1300]|uniref:hypothetical protein n=1 Tax=Prochlorococcus sp. MIT 1300 TaxID=3096218 RepID=UPI002A7525FC|nr:hypothetical protein [Prochlorococcus sp. MIT 1300]